MSTKLNLREVLESFLALVVADQDTNEQGALRDILTDLRHISKDKNLNFENALEGSEEVAITEGWLEKKMDLVHVIIENTETNEVVAFDDFDTIEVAIAGLGWIIDKERSLAQKETMLLIETDEATRVIDKGYALLNGDYTMEVPNS